MKRWIILLVVSLIGSHWLCNNGCDEGLTEDDQRSESSQTRTSSVVTGSLDHDFGTVRIGNVGVEMVHTFQLTNRSGKELLLDDVYSSCGSAVAKPAKTRIAPDEVVAIDVTLKLDQPGRRNETVRLFWENRDIEDVVLRVAGAAVREQDFYASHESIRLSTGNAMNMVLVATNIDSDAKPDVPTIESPDTFKVEFRGWTQVMAHDAESKRPARWHGEVHIKRIAEPHADGEWMLISYGHKAGKPWIVECTGRPWRRMP